jgi:O-acetyl-ADP-ribose deacetylase (regulator of RNase III)
MIIYKNGNLFDSNAQTIVNTVNCVGVMGKGIALTFKNKYPNMFNSYKTICDKQLLSPGKLLLYTKETPWILNFPTKNHWKNPSKIEYIEEGLRKFVEIYKEKGITSIAFPLLGCANGGLNWEEQVKPIMEQYLSNLDISVEIWIYKG